MKRILSLTALIILLSAALTDAADRLRIAYSSISAAYMGIWVARDAGLFAKEGLEDQIIFIPSATQLAQVLVAGDVDVASLGGGPVMAASLSGADLKVFGNNVNKWTLIKPRLLRRAQNLWSFQRGRASLWSRAGFKPRP